MQTVTWNDVQSSAIDLADRWRGGDIDSVHGVPRGGLVPAALVAAHLALPIVTTPGPRTLVVDDLVDSGATRARFAEFKFDVLFTKTAGDAWLVFPWETNDEQAGPTDAVVRLLSFVGEDPTREGLLDTPGRVLRAYTEMTEGYAQDPHEILSTVFDEDHDQMVTLEGIDFTSLCEHHLLPFVGTATVGYIPNGKVVGLSKLARLVECYARRLQVQERMTQQIAGALMTELHPEGVGVILRAHHACMGCRGVKKPGAVMTTSVLHGLIKHDPSARAEFLAFSK